MFSCEGLGVSLEALQHVYAKLNSVFAQNSRPLMSCVAREMEMNLLKSFYPGAYARISAIFN